MPFERVEFSFLFFEMLSLVSAFSKFDQVWQLIIDFPNPNIHYPFFISSRYSLFSFHPRLCSWNEVVLRSTSWETTIYTQWWGLLLEFIVKNLRSKYLTFGTIYWETVGAMGISYSRAELSCRSFWEQNRKSKQTKSKIPLTWRTRTIYRTLKKAHRTLEHCKTKTKMDGTT